MIFDHHFIKGHSHTVCEDYAASHYDVAALSDGCSMTLDSNGKKVDSATDVGARLLVRSSMFIPFELELDPSGLTGVRQVIEQARAFQNLLHYTEGTLSATLFTLHEMKDEIHFIGCGDGVIGSRCRESKEWEFHWIQFPGKPFYPRYINTQYTWDFVKEESNGEFMIHDILDGKIEATRVLRILETPIIHEVYSSVANDMVIALSDGATSFTKNGVLANIPAIIQRFSDIRIPKGRFVLRNLIGIIKDLEKEGFVHQDDISMIAAYQA